MKQKMPMLLMNYLLTQAYTILITKIAQSFYKMLRFTYGSHLLAKEGMLPTFRAYEVVNINMLLLCTFIIRHQLK